MKNEIYKLECSLLSSDVRKSSNLISEIISKEFIEYTSSGKVYKYCIGDVFQEYEDNKELKWEIIDFSIKELGDECILALYKLVKHNEEKPYSLRSSIWRKDEDGWKMIFHQGTIIS